MNEVIELAEIIYAESRLPKDMCDRLAARLVKRGCRSRREGEWVKNDHGDTICSCCRFPVNYKSHYCPECGSRNVLGHHGLWRPAADWPPESDGRYLMATHDGEILVAKWENGVLFCPAALNTAVKWWMPAPELPES